MRAQPSYIRTIKPNQNRSASEFDDKAVLHQIKYLGLQENIRVRRAGFAYRNAFEKMVERFYLLSPNTSYAGEYTWQGDPKSGCEKILTDTGISKDEWQMGVTKAFIKNPETVILCDLVGSLRRVDDFAFSSLHWKLCEIGIGIIWLLVFNEPGAIICDTRMSVPVASSDSGRQIRRTSSSPESETMGTNYWEEGRKGGGSVYLATGDSWATILVRIIKILLDRS